jgi:hypothetical protein
VDSSGTFPSGIAVDSISHSTGNFDECLAIENVTLLNTINVNPQYCLFKLRAKPFKPNMVNLFLLHYILVTNIIKSLNIHQNYVLGEQIRQKYDIKYFNIHRTLFAIILLIE